MDLDWSRDERNEGEYMSYRQEIHGQMSIPEVDELMEEAERKKRVEIPEDWDTEEELMGRPVAAPLAVPPELVGLPLGSDAVIRTTGPMKIDHPSRFQGAALAEGVILDDPVHDPDSEFARLQRQRIDQYNNRQDDREVSRIDDWSIHLSRSERDRRMAVAYKILQAARAAGVHLTQEELRVQVVAFESDQKVWNEMVAAGHVKAKDLIHELTWPKPEPQYTEEEKVQRAKESWEYNKATQDLVGEIPPGWFKSVLPDEPIKAEGIPMKVWDSVRLAGPGTTAAAVEDEALRRRVREALKGLELLAGEPHLELERGCDRQDVCKDFYIFVDGLIADLPELLGRYEALFALAEVYANSSPVDLKGTYVSRRPQENAPGTDHL